MRRHGNRGKTYSSIVILMVLPRLVSAAIVPMGDVSPDPTNPLLVFATALDVGEDENGSLRVDGGSLLETSGATLGRQTGATGTATVTGASSTWDSTFVTSPTFYVGRRGRGELSILAGGQLVSGRGRIASEIGGSGFVIVDGTNSQWLNDGLRIGDRGDGELTVSDGAELMTTGGSSLIGAEFGSSGVATITGEQTVWHSDDNINVGQEGNGRLEILAGAEVQSTHSNIANGAATEGHVVVRGEGSRWINSRSVRVGSTSLGSAAASLTIDQGAYVESSEFATVATGQAVTADVIVDGVGTNWAHDGDLQLGIDGVATFGLHGGAQHSNVSAFLGFGLQGDGTVEVSGEGTLWQSSEELWVGLNGPGRLSVTEGGRVESPMALVGAFATGKVEVRGENSEWQIDESAFIGGFSTGSGLLTIAEKAAVEIDGELTLGVEAGGTGEILVDTESTLEIRGVSTIGSAANSNGTLTIRGEAEVDVYEDLTFALEAGSTGTLNLETDGVLDMNGERILVGAGNSNFFLKGGTLKNTGVFGTNLNQTGGTLAAGNSPGTMQIQGDYQLGDAAILEVEIAPYMGDEAVAGIDFDFYQVDGEAMLAGTLDVLADGQYLPQAGDSFVVLTAATIDASNLLLTGLPGFGFDVIADSGGGQALVLAFVPEPHWVAVLAPVMLLLMSTRKQRSRCSS